MENSLTVLEKITEIGVPKTDAEKIVSSFGEVAETMSELEKELWEINTHTEVTKSLCDKARSVRLQYVKARTAGDRIHKELKEGLLLRTRAIDGVRNVYKLKCTEIETKLKDIELHFEKIEEAKLDKLFAERVEKLSKYVEDTSIYNLRDMSEIGFNELLLTSKVAHETRLKEEKEAEEARAAKEKADAEEAERIRKENEQLKADAEAREAELAKEREAQAKKDKIEADRLKKLQDEIDAKNKADADRLAKEAEEKAKADAEVKAQQEADAQAKKQAELAPDKDKLSVFANKLSEVNVPGVESEEAKQKLNEAIKLIA